MRSIFLHEYFEDENGQQVSMTQVAVAATGNRHAAFLPPGTTKADIVFFQAEKRPIDLSKITLSRDQLEILGYFVRDLSEMTSSAFYKNGPATLTTRGAQGRKWALQTAATDEEIRSFVTIFRRLYMERDPANFGKTAAVFAEALHGHPIATWIQGLVDQHKSGLQEVPSYLPLVPPGTLTFTKKRLIDVYIYTRYSHQPSKDRARQFKECLTAVNGDQMMLTFLFLTELWKCALRIRNAGVFIEQFYDNYCQAHSIAPGLLASMRTDHPGLGALEKREVREARVLQEKALELAHSLWRDAGEPVGGYALFLDSARRQLQSALETDQATRS